MATQAEIVNSADSRTETAEDSAVELPAYLPAEYFPSLYTAADSSARHGQTKFLRFSRAELLFGVLTAILGLLFAFGWERLFNNQSSATTWQRVVLAVTPLIAFLARITNKTRAYDAEWFQSRAIAETLKSSTWRYMMRGAPYDDRASAEEIDKEFHRNLMDTIQAAGAFHSALYRSLPAVDQITPFMREQRAASLDDRKDLYLRSRVDEQVKWYTAKAEKSEQASNRWFWLGTIFQALTLTVAVLAVGSIWLAGLIGLFATLSGTSTALAGLGRHDEIKKSYVLAAYDLSYLRTAVTEALAEAEFARTIDDAEEAISREHTMWMAKKH